MIKIIPPLFQHIFGQIPCTSKLSEHLSSNSKLLPVDGSQKLCSHDRHILWIARTNKKMTFISTCTASHTDIHKEFKRPESTQSIFEAFMYDLFPIFRQFPVILKRVPLPRIWHVNIFEIFGVSTIAIYARHNFSRRIHPALK